METGTIYLTIEEICDDDDDRKKMQILSEICTNVVNKKAELSYLFPSFPRRSERIKKQKIK